MLTRIQKQMQKQSRSISYYNDFNINDINKICETAYKKAKELIQEIQEIPKLYNIDSKKIIDYLKKFIIIMDVKSKLN